MSGDALLAVDEVQAGDRPRRRVASISQAGVGPDVVSLAKALGGGLPIGALVARADLSFEPGEHASTFGGGPVAVRGARSACST